MPDARRPVPKIEGRDHFGVFPEWREPDDWRKVTFTHTITQTTCWGLPHFNPGTSLYLVEDRAPQPGEMFIWCQRTLFGIELKHACNAPPSVVSTPREWRS
jgi:hypothetical protein